MTSIAPLITGYLRQHLPIDQGCSSHTVDSYASAFKLFFEFAARRIGVRPSKLHIEQIDSKLVLAFLLYLEQERKNTPTTRNVRLAAIKAFMRYVEMKVPSALEATQQIKAIPSKRYDHKLIRHLNTEEVRAIIDAPDTTMRIGVRDRAMIHLCFAAGLRVSELVGLPVNDLSLREPPSISVLGKGRRERCLPLWKETTQDLRAWMAVRGVVRVPELFVNARGDAMTRAGFEYVLDKHARSAGARIPSLRDTSVSPHQLRHSCAVLMLRATHDVRKVALWLGHADIRTTEAYLRLNPADKLDAVEVTLPPGLQRGKFKAPDALIALLQGVE